MPDAGFLGAASAEQPSQVVEAPAEVPAASEQDAYNVAERQAEQQMEQAAKAEQEGAFLEQAPTSTVAAVATPATGIAEPVAIEKDEITIEVEKILEYGLGDYIPDMPEEARARFLKKGGEVAAQLSHMVRTLNVQVQLVAKLVKEWLLTIPGVNRYYIEQEAKLKTDQIVELANEHRETGTRPPS